jgi:UMF1 family MFS transporter
VDGNRSKRWAWALYDVGNSAFWLTIVAAVFPIYFTDLYLQARPGADATQAVGALAYAATAAMVVVAVLGPVLGAMADRVACKKKLLAGFAGLGIVATGLMVFIGPGDVLLAAVLYAVGTIGVAGSIVFYDALLPSVAAPEELDRVSSMGFAAGYLGSVLLFGVQVAMIMKPELFGLPSASAAMRVSFGLTALWWAAFTIPLLLKVPEPPPAGGNPGGLLDGFRQLASTFREAKRYKQLFLFLAAFWIYSDGIGTIMKLGSGFGKSLGVGHVHLLLALILTQLVGVPCALAFGRLALRFGAKRMIAAGLLVYAGLCVFALVMDRPFHFYVLAATVGLVQGGTQALSRSLFASLVPKGRSGEFFGFFSTMEKFAGILGPLLLGVVWSGGGDPRHGILFLSVFFVVGGALLLRVDEKAGREAAAA